MLIRQDIHSTLFITENFPAMLIRRGRNGPARNAYPVRVKQTRPQSPNAALAKWLHRRDEIFSL
jgi:hypothetical protein